MHLAAIATAISIVAYDPLAGELEQFPPYSVVHANFTFNRVHEDWLFVVENLDFTVGWVQENCFIGGCWAHLLRAQDRGHSLEFRQGHLDAFKQKLAEFGYPPGAIPPPSPVYRFRHGKPTELELILLNTMLAADCPA